MPADSRPDHAAARTVSFSSVMDAFEDLAERENAVIAAARVVAALSMEGRATYGRFVSRTEFQSAMFDLETAVVALDKKAPDA